MELRILTEGMYTRDDIHRLQETVAKGEAHLNLTYGDTESLLNETVLLEDLEISVVQLMNFINITETRLKNIFDS